MKRFGEFIRRAVVIVPTDEEFKKRVAKRKAEEGKDVPNEAVLKMKGTDKTYENHFFYYLFFISLLFERINFLSIIFLCLFVCINS